MLCYILSGPSVLRLGNSMEQFFLRIEQFLRQPKSILQSENGWKSGRRGGLKHGGAAIAGDKPPKEEEENRRDLEIISEESKEKSIVGIKLNFSPIVG